MTEIVINEKEKWYMSRRIWGAGLSLIATIVLVLAPERYETVAPMFTVIASMLGITSFVKPKK